MSSTGSPAAPARPLTLASEALVAAAVQHMDDGFAWFHELGTAERAWVTEVVRAGIGGFADWLAQPALARNAGSAVFGAAPVEMARAITLEQTVALVRTTVAVVESAVDELADASERRSLREAILRYSREVAFSAAEVYARAAEEHGAWSARVEAMVVDSLLRDELDVEGVGRLSALGWPAGTPSIVAASAAPAAAESLRHALATHGLGVLTGVHGSTLIVVIGGSTDIDRAGRILTQHLNGPIVVSDVVPSLVDIGAATRDVLAGLAAVRAWPDAPRPVRADDLLPERALDGDPRARTALVNDVFGPLAGDEALLQTTSVLLESTGSIEGTARRLFVHPNTVRHRLRRIADLTGYHPLDPRDAYVLRLALTLGRQSQ